MVKVVQRAVVVRPFRNFADFHPVPESIGVPVRISVAVTVTNICSAVSKLFIDLHWIDRSHFDTKLAPVGLNG